MLPLEPGPCYQAVLTRDARFDGRVFVGVTSTGVYCRPVCPARTPKAAHCRFFASAAAAQVAGFRPCLRCRPEVAPEHGAWRGTSNTVQRGLELIAGGALDAEEASVESLAERLGVGERQLRRLFERHLGASPIAVAQTRRVLFAKHLLHETRLPMAEVALASGFGSVRRFNETFQSLFGRPPSELRRKATNLPGAEAAGSELTLRLRYRPPYDWGAMLGFLRARALAGVEQVGDARYARTFTEAGVAGTVEVVHEPKSDSLAVTVRTAQLSALPYVVNRVRRVFDLGADVPQISAHLAQDPLLRRLLAARPGLRVPSGWGGFELGVRAVLGQHVSVAAARQLGQRLVLLCGSAGAFGASLTHTFPTPEQLAQADLLELGVPRARAEALKALAFAVLDDPLLFEPRDTLDETVARLCSVRGVGAWTAQYIALRAAREPDAFPASDRGLLRAMERHEGGTWSPALLERRADRWRPWRAYAAQHLWAADAADGAKLLPQPSRRALRGATQPTTEAAHGTFR